MELTARQRQLLEFVAERDTVDLREVNAVMGWSDEQLRATADPLVEDRLVTVKLAIPFAADASPGWWKITDRGRQAVRLTPKPI